MVTCRVYRDETVTELPFGGLTSFDPTTLGPNDMVWVDLSAPTPDEERTVLQQWFGAHELVIEDIKRARRTTSQTRLHHPKVEDYDRYLFVILHTLAYQRDEDDDTAGDLDIRGYQLEQLSMMIGENILITHHLSPLKAIAKIEQSCLSNRRVMARGPDYVTHLILDEVADLYLPLTTAVEDKLSEIERSIFRNPTTLTLQRILEIKRIVQEVRRSVVYQREMVNRLARGEFELISDEEVAYYRNVYDHLVRVADQLESNRDSVMSMMDAYFSVSNARLNQVMKVLTVISTIFLPLTFVCSVYGMNFKYMPELDMPYAYPIVWAVLLVSSGLMWSFFRRKGWLE